MINFTYAFATVSIDGFPSNMMTRSARYVAMMKSCSTTNAVFLACRINLQQCYHCDQQIITALHAMQTRYCEENSVRLSVTRVIPDKTEERSVQIFIPYERTFILVF